MEIPRGEITKTVYNLIKDEKFPDAIEILEQLLDLQPNSRSALSLLGYCYFQTQSFENAANAYDRLTNLHPDIPEYQFYLAQSLYNATSYEEALKSSYLRADPNPELQEKVIKLQAVIQYCKEDITDAKALVEKCPNTDPDSQIGLGCLEYKAENYKEAAVHFANASNVINVDPQLLYNKAVTNYQLGDLPTAAHFLGEIIEEGVMLHPELGLGHKPEDKDTMASVGNSRTLHKTALIEALNLKAAIEFDLGKPTSAQETLRDLPPRTDEETDAITLHNHAILHGKSEAEEAIRKLRYLLEQMTFPPETFSNLLVFYYRYEQFDLIADLMAACEEYKFKYLCPNLRSFFEALIRRETAPDEAVKGLEELCSRLADTLRRYVKQVEEFKCTGSDDQAKKICNEFDEIVDGIYAPALMAIGKIYWEKEDLNEVEKTLRQGTEFLEDRDCWLTNVAHVVFCKGKDFEQAVGFYEMIRRNFSDKLLDVSAISLANLCASYILIHRTEEAERLIKNIEDQEKALLDTYPGVKVFHSCIMNMVIGTLYCVKNNYEFGISRIIKSLEDLKLRLGPDTWFHAKRCMLSMFEKLVKNSVTMKEDVLLDCLEFLRQCEDFGREVSTVIAETNNLPQSSENLPVHYGVKTVSYEARYFRWLLSQILEFSIVSSSTASSHPLI